MSNSDHYDYFVIGAGSGGTRSARIAAAHGAKVGIAEGRHIGGTCVNVGCVPKKLMAYAADFSAEFEDAKAYGWNGIGESPCFDWPYFIKKKDAEIKRLSGLYEDNLERHGVDVFKENASFLDQNTLQVGNKTVTADKFLIAVGARPNIPDRIQGVEHCITSDDLFALERQPDHIIIVGGGYIAVEFAHIFHGMGSKVSLIYRGELFLKSFDDDLSHHLAEEMKKQGIDVYFNCDVMGVEKTDEGRLRAITSDGTDPGDADQILMATGRVANIEGLDLEKAGVEMEDGLVKINTDYQTKKAHIYAVGDVANNINLTPVAIQEGHALADNLFGKEDNRSVNYNFIPTAIFSRPEIGTIGLSEKEARARGHDITIYKSRFRPMKNTISGRDEYSLVKLIVDKKDNRVIGCHMIGTDAAEIIQGFAIAMNCGATKSDFDKTIAVHPSAAEEFVTLR